MNYNSPDLYEGDPSRYCLSNERTKGRDANISQRLLANFWLILNGFGRKWCIFESSGLRCTGFLWKNLLFFTVQKLEKLWYMYYNLHTVVYMFNTISMYNILFTYMYILWIQCTVYVTAILDPGKMSTQERKHFNLDTA